MSPFAILALELFKEFGIPAARGMIDIVKTWKTPDDPTAADWDALESLVNKPLVDPGSPALPAGTVLKVQ